MEFLQVHHHYRVHVPEFLFQHLDDPEQLSDRIRTIVPARDALFLDQGEVAAHDIEHQVALVCEVGIQRFFGNAHAVGDIVHRDGTGAVLPEHVERRVQDPFLNFFHWFSIIGGEIDYTDKTMETI